MEDNLVKGAVDILDVRFGSLWTSITREEFNHLKPEFGERFEVTIYNNDMLVYQNQVTYGKSFADVRIGQPILYINSLYRVGLAINQGSFAKAYNVGVGASWNIEIRKMDAEVLFEVEGEARDLGMFRGLHFSNQDIQEKYQITRGKIFHTLSQKNE